MVLSGKSEKALRTIGEVAEDLGVEPHVLRFWESKFKQIKPQKRRGRRYYRPEDVKLVNVIQSLLYTQGFTIKGAQRFLQAQKKEDIDNVLQLAAGSGKGVLAAQAAANDSEAPQQAAEEAAQQSQPQQPISQAARAALRAASPASTLQPSLFAFPNRNTDGSAVPESTQQTQQQPERASAAQAETANAATPAKAEKSFTAAERRRLGEIYRGLCYTKEKLDEAVG